MPALLKTSPVVILIAKTTMGATRDTKLSTKAIARWETVSATPAKFNLVIHAGRHLKSSYTVQQGLPPSSARAAEGGNSSAKTRA
eukprot:7807489-Alexandrium_andersonii.AAC.1